jgi:hypothetical protein
MLSPYGFWVLFVGAQNVEPVRVLGIGHDFHSLINLMLFVIVSLFVVSVIVAI